MAHITSVRDPLNKQTREIYLRNKETQESLKYNVMQVCSVNDVISCSSMHSSNYSRLCHSDHVLTF